MVRAAIACFAFFASVMMISSAAASEYEFDEPRNIYVGDIFTLSIESEGMPEQELEGSFSGFEVVDIRRDGGGWLVSLRTFETGEKTINIGGREVVVTVASTLDDLQRDGIFEGGDELMRPGFTLNWRIASYAALGLFVASGCAVFLPRLISKRAKPEGGYQRFLRSSSALSPDSEGFLVDLTFYFKEYVGSISNRKIVGKTSAEIMEQLQGIPEFGSLLPEIQAWLSECDRIKFTGAHATRDEIQAHFDKLLHIAGEIDGLSEVAA